METVTSKHWTAGSIEDFTFRIASDFLAQVETKIEAGEVTRAELAHRLGRTPGRVSQLFNNPGNLTVTSAVRLVRAAGMKVALIAYDDNDPQNNNGPVNSEIFNRCWKHMGAPKTFFEFASTTASVENCFNNYSVSGSNLTGGTGCSYMTTKLNASVSGFDAGPIMVTVAGSHDVNSGCVVHYQGTGGTGIYDASNTGLVFNENGIVGLATLGGVRVATTTAIKSVSESFYTDGGAN